ncbi:MAG: calcium/sodium antiporter [Bacteroidales bacterium]
MEYLLTLLGFFLLIGSGNFLVKGSVSLARYFGLSTLVIGVTIVAFGTSAPELLVSLQAALADHPGMALGNVIGSNISNIALVLAITAIILPIPVNRNTIIFDWPVMMGVTLLLGVFALDLSLGLIEGLVFNLVLLLFVWYSVKQSRKKNRKEKIEVGNGSYSLRLSVGIIIISTIGLAFGARLLVNNATTIAQSLGVSDRAIGISMLAIGTSLPELVTSVIAAIQKETDISVGNIVGSNIFNILSVIGITAVVKPIAVDPVILWDIGVMIVISLLLFFMIIPSRSGKIIRLEGIILFSLYIIYMIYVFK